MNKRGFEVQFNWIFVLIAGAAILIFFSVVVIKQKNVAEISTKATVLKNVDAIIAAAGVSTDTTNIVSIPDSDITVGCNRISLGTVSKQHENLILFAPSLIKGDRLITQTLAFNTPYRATNLLYMTSPQIRYIIIGSSHLAKEINRTLPSEIKKEFYSSLEEIKNSNNYKVKFIILGEMIEFPRQLAKMPDFDVTAIRVNEDLNMVEFWRKEGISWQAKGMSPFIGKASLIGAIYSGTQEDYECNMQNAFSRLGLVTKVYMERTKKLRQDSQISAKQLQCNKIYSNAIAQLDSIYSASSKFSNENSEQISSSAKLLAAENKEAQLYSCTLIF